MAGDEWNVITKMPVTGIELLPPINIEPFFTLSDALETLTFENRRVSLCNIPVSDLYSSESHA